MKTTKSKLGWKKPQTSDLASSTLLAAIEEATEILRSEGLQSKRLTVRTYKFAPAPKTIGPMTSSGCENCSGRVRRCWRDSWAST